MDRQRLHDLVDKIPEIGVEETEETLNDIYNFYSEREHYLKDLAPKEKVDIQPLMA